MPCRQGQSCAICVLLHRPRHGGATGCATTAGKASPPLVSSPSSGHDHFGESVLRSQTSKLRVAASPSQIPRVTVLIVRGGLSVASALRKASPLRGIGPPREMAIVAVEHHAH